MPVKLPFRGLLGAIPLIIFRAIPLFMAIPLFVLLQYFTFVLGTLIRSNLVFCERKCFFPPYRYILLVLFRLHNYNCILPFVCDINLMLLHFCSHGQWPVISRSVCETMYALTLIFKSGPF